MSLSLTEREPLAVRAAIVAVLTAAVHVAAVYGLVDGDAEKAIGGLIDAIGLVVLVLVVRPSTVSAAKVVTRVTNEGAVVAGEAAERATGAPVAVLPGAAALDDNNVGAPVIEPVAVRAELVAPPAGDADVD